MLNSILLIVLSLIGIFLLSGNQREYIIFNVMVWLLFIFLINFGSSKLLNGKIYISFVIVTWIICAIISLYLLRFL